MYLSWGNIKMSSVYLLTEKLEHPSWLQTQAEVYSQIEQPSWPEVILQHGLLSG